MEALTRTLISVCLCIQVTQTDGSSWTVKVPSSVKGLVGSCVVIPCSYDYPQPGNKVTSYTGIWNNNNHQPIFHPVKEKILEQYRDRTTLIGDITNKNCSLKIDNFRSSDGGPFHFRIEMENYSKYSYLNHKVSISTINEPQPVISSMVEEIKEGQSVSPSCSVFYSCPTSPPVFNWSHSGDQRFHSELLSDSQWKATSTLTFRLTRADHMKSLQCSVQMHNGKPLYTGSKVLQVKYAPVNVKVEYESDVKEGQTVHLNCSSDANPRVSSYEWHNVTGAQVHKGSTYTLQNVSRHTKVPLYCTAVNELGRINSSLVQFNVLYAPEIKHASSCSSEGDMVKCVCMAESNPPSIIHFVLSNKVHLNTEVVQHGSLTVGTLQANVGSSTYVRCVANNTEGSANVTLSLPVKINMLYIYISAGAAGGLMILVAAVIVIIKCRRRSGDTPECNMSATKAEKELELSVPQYSMAQRSVRKGTYDDVGCQSIYATDHIYGNMEDEADAIYANT